MILPRKATVLPVGGHKRARIAKVGVIFSAALLGLAAAVIVVRREGQAPFAGPMAARRVPLDPAQTAALSNHSCLSAETVTSSAPVAPNGDAQPHVLPAQSAQHATPISHQPPKDFALTSQERPAISRTSWIEIAEGQIEIGAAPVVAAAAEAEASQSPPMPSESPAAEESPAAAGRASEAAPAAPTKPRLKLPLFKSLKASPGGKEPDQAPRSAATKGQPPSPPLAPAEKPPAQSALPAGAGTKIPLSGTPPAERVTLRQSDGLISLATHNAPLSEVLMALARQLNLNIVCTENLRASITVTLDRVPLQTVLDSVLSIAGCTWVLQDDVIYVTSTADRTKLPPGVQGRQVRVFRLDFAAAADVEKAVKGMLSPVGQAFTTVAKNTDNRQTQELVVVEDLPHYLQTIAAYIEQVDQPPRQVLIEAHVLAITLDSSDRCGVDLTALFKVLHHDMKFYAQGIANPAAPQAFFFTFDGSDLDILIEALRTQNQAKTLASPKVLVLNGQEAKIQIGRQDGYRVVTTTETSAMESINFLDTGVLLTVTPRISRDGQVLMHVKPEVSDGQVQDGLPSKKTTEIQTDVMLPNGRGMVIGGLIRDTDTELHAKVPFFGDLYLVGKLFRRREMTKKREEIIITLIPRVVPGTLACDDRHAHEVQQAETRLLDRNLERVPRPWDGRLPDALENPARFRDIPAIKAWHQRCAAGCPQCLGGAGSACGEAEPYYAPDDAAMANPSAERAGQTPQTPTLPQGIPHE